MVNREKIEKLIYELLLAIGENPERDGLKETPMRVAKMYGEIFSGMDEDVVSSLKTFKDAGNSGDILIVKDIPFYSMCEHHLLPFFGVVHVAYIPENNEIIGLSKIARIVSCYSKRLQIQEKMTNQIADFIFGHIRTSAVAVFAEAEHLCMTMRGIRAMGSKTITSSMKGLFNSDKEKKEEVYSLLKC